MKKIIPLVFLLTIIFTGTSKSQMFWNQAASFAGNVTSYISVPNSSTIDLTGSFTLEAWVNPVTLTVSSKGVLSKGSSLGTTLRYSIRLTTAGRVSVSTGGAQRIISRLSNPVVINKWTHISATYNSSTSLYSIYINGVLDTTATVPGTAPPTNTDSLFIGISGSSTPFNGKLDEVRIWKRDLSPAEVGQNFRTSLSASSGIYSGLVLSMTFQKESNDGIVFTARDLTDNQNNGNPRNVTAIDESFRPLHTISQNDCIELDGDEDYLAAKDTSTIEPTIGLSIECWVFPRTLQTCNLITKGNQYAIILDNGIFKGMVNGVIISSGVSISPNIWTKLTFQYTGTFSFHVNGKFRSNSSGPFPPINSGTDSLYIGGAPGATGDFNGFIDEVRISDHFYTDDEIYSTTYTSIDRSNDPSPTLINISYNLDGSLADNTENGGPKLFFRNNAQFSHPATAAGKPVSPLVRDVSNTVSDGYYLFEDINRRIPSTGTSGTATMLAFVNMKKIITDVDVFVALNHTNLSSLSISLIAPNGDSVRLIKDYSNGSTDNNLMTLFDDQADSLLGNNKYTSLYTKVRPENNMNSIFSGDNTSGTWRIRISDGAASDTGIAYVCGIRFNNMNVIEKNFNLTSYIQGFYNPVTNEQVADTLKMYLRESFSPFALVDSAKALSNIAGSARFSFANAQNGHSYYIQVNHRNSIETWGAFNRIFKYSEASYLFYLSSISAYGNNEIQVDASPVTFAFYNGDSNQDGLINLNDILLISNDATSFTTGYIPTDVTGDNIANLNDILIAFNNSNNFVHKITP